MLTSTPTIALWLLGLAPGSASGSASDPSIGVAPMASVGGEASAASPAQLDDAVRQGLGRGERPLEVLDGDCPDRSCWIEHAREHGMGHVLLPRIERRGPDHTLQIDVVATANGEVIASIDRVCEICGEDELLATTADLAAELLPRLDRLRAEPSEVVIDGRPLGATIELDGRVVGTVPWHGELGPGTHTVRLVKEGYLPSSRTLTTTAGVRERLEVELLPQPQPQPEIEDRDPARRHRGLVAAGGSLLGVGVLGVATGVGLFALDGRPYYSECPADAVDINGRCPKMYEATAPAVVTVALGGAALVTGAALLVHALRRKRRSRPTADVAFVPGRRGASLALRF